MKLEVTYNLPDPTLAIVAFVDLLGVAQQMLTDYMEAFKIIAHFQEILASERENRPELYDLLIYSFSDAVIFILPVGDRLEPEKEDQIEQLGTLISNIMTDAMLNDIPIRGAISMGNIVTEPHRAIEGQYFVSGRPLVEAYRFKGIQNWVGISLCVPTSDWTTTIRTKFLKFRRILEHANIIQEYPVPLGNNTISTYVVKWKNEGSKLPALKQKLLEIIDSEEELASSERTIETQNEGEVNEENERKRLRRMQKYRNTLPFLEHLIREEVIEIEG